jgi:glycosyltransferase involved in cell wall biosynthesis
MARFIRGNVFIPDPRNGWKRFAVPKALEVMKAAGIKTIITAGPPHSTHFIGAAIKDRTGARWVADFHDLWTDVIYYDMLYHLPFVKRWDLRLERTILEKADVVLTVGDRYREKLLSKSAAIDAQKVKVVRIGYDEKVIASVPPPPPPGAFTVTYTGSIADFYDPSVFIRALARTLQQFPQVSFVLRFVGVLSGGIRQQLLDAGLGGILEETGYVSHTTSIRYLKGSTLLLLVNPQTKDEAMVIPGKLYEYLAVGKPIINITRHDAETAAIISACAAGATFARDEAERLEAFLVGKVQEWLSPGGVVETGGSQLVRQYARENIAVLLGRYIQ